MQRAFYLITYDIPNDKRRLKVSKALEALGERVQYSVFEAWLTGSELEALQKRLRGILDGKEDSVRIYVLCAICRGKVQTLGLGEITAPPEVVIL